MRFYVERADFSAPSTHDRRRVALLDTDSSETNFRVERILEKEIDRSASQSMIALEYQSPPYQGLREGSWYDIDDDTLRRFEYTPVNPEGEGGVFLRAHMKGPAEEIAFSKMRAPQDNVDIEPATPLDFSSAPSNLQLVVVDCGQGNWNEIRSDDERIIYDIGASSTYARPQIQQLVTQSQLQKETRPVHVFISHWDIDHYQSLLCCSAAELGVIKSFVVPSQIPNTQTFRNVQNLLTASGVPVRSVPPATRPAGTGRQVLLCLLYRSGPYQVFRAVPGQHRNHTGIMLTVDGPNRAAILTGDHHYGQILTALSANPTKADAVMIAPHHGGRAGSMDITTWTALLPSLITPISVGDQNPYGHPIVSVVRDLELLQAVPPPETRNQGTLTYPL